MNLKEAIQQILPHYESAVIEMPKEGHYNFLRSLGMENGICSFAFVKLGKSSIYEEMEYQLQTDGFIGNSMPNRWNKYDENLKEIQNRVDWMREYLSKN